jgi:hypothetical protein
MEALADYNNELVKRMALELTKNCKTDREKLEKLFYYVRDDIKFGFVKNGDLVKASETISEGIGQCNTKTNLFLALCKSVGIPAKIHFSLIDRSIQRGVFPPWAYNLLPKQISHSWLEVEIDGKVHRVDTYINDSKFFENAKRELKDKGWNTGYSLACSRNPASANLNLDNEVFSQMDAVTDDHGTFDEPMAYYQSAKYHNRPSRLKKFLYQNYIGIVNRRVEKIRSK